MRTLNPGILVHVDAAETSVTGRLRYAAGGTHTDHHTAKNLDIDSATVRSTIVMPGIIVVFPRWTLFKAILHRGYQRVPDIAAAFTAACLIVQLARTTSPLQNAQGTYV